MAGAVFPSDTLLTGINGAFGVNPLNSFYASGSLKCNGKILTDVTTSNGAAISSASYTFNSSDVGKLISIPGGIAGVTGNAGGYLNTTIASVANGQATLTTPPTQAIAGTAVATFGNDDTAAFQTLVNSAASVASLNGGTIILPAGIIIVSSVTWLSGVSCFGQGINASIVKHIMTTDAITAMFYNNVGGAATIANCQFQNFQMDMEAATSTAAYQVLASCLRILQPTRNTVTNCWLHGSPATCLALDFGVACVISNNIISNYGRSATAASFGGAGFGVAINAAASWTVTGNVFISPTTANSTYGCFFEAETAATAEGVATVTGNVFVGTGTLAAIGDCGLRRFTCTGNHILVPTGSANTGSGIVAKGGTVGQFAGLRGMIADNMITLAVNGIEIDYTAGIDAGQIAAYVIRGNRIQACTGNGIKITAASAVVMSSLQIDGNFLDSNKFCAIIFLGAGGFADLTIRNNVCLNNGALGSAITTCAIAFSAGNVSRLMMTGNDCYDNGTGTQKFGIGINTGVTISGGFIIGNNLANNGTGPVDLLGTISAGCIVKDNPPYNPIGASSASPGASPWTFTAPTSPGVLFLSATTAITALTQNGVSILSGVVGVATPYNVPFNANDVIIVTYTGTLSANKMVN